MTVMQCVPGVNEAPQRGCGIKVGDISVRPVWNAGRSASEQPRGRELHRSSLHSHTQPDRSLVIA